MSDGSCHVETHDEGYRRHFSAQNRVHASDVGNRVRPPIDNLFCVTFHLGALEFEQASHVIKIISGEIEPEPE
jgi:hypothetical protein